MRANCAMLGAAATVLRNQTLGPHPEEAALLARPSRRMAAGTISPVAVLRDARKSALLRTRLMDDQAQLMPRSPPQRRCASHFHAQPIVVFAAILVNNAHHDAVRTGFKIDGKARRPNVRARLNLGPRLPRRLVSGKYLPDKRIRPGFASHRHWGKFADPVFDSGPRATVEDVDDHLGHAQSILADWSPEKLAHLEFVLGRNMVRTDKNDAHLPTLGLLGSAKPGRKAIAVDVKDVEAVGIAIGTIRDRNPPTVEG